MKESLSGFPFEYNSRSFEKRSRTLVEEGKELVGHNIGYWLSGLCSSVSSFVCKLVSSPLGLPNSVLFISYRWIKESS